MLTHWEKYLQAVKFEFEMNISTGSGLSSIGCVLLEQH